MRALAVAVAMIGFFSAASQAHAQGFCAEGRTREGACVNVGLASGQRLAAVVLGQTRLSFSILPVLPSQDAGANNPTLRGHVGREVSVIHP